MASRERVYHESLHVKQRRAYSYVFTRQWDPDRKGYIVKQQQFILLSRILPALQTGGLVIIDEFEADVVGSSPCLEGLRYE